MSWRIASGTLAPKLSDRAPEIPPLPGAENSNATTLARRKVLEISGDQRIGGGACRHFKKFGVIRIGQLNRQCNRVRSFARTPKKVQDVIDVVAGKAELRPHQDFSIFKIDPMVQGQSRLTRQDCIKNAGRYALGTEKGGYQNVGIHHDFQCLPPAAALRLAWRPFLMIA